MEDLIAARPGIVAECAGQAAVAEVGPAVLEAGIDLAVISIGALADPRLADRLTGAAVAGGAQVILPAGAIGAVDALAAMRLAGLARVTYRSRKPPAAWKGSPPKTWPTSRRWPRATVLFRGTAREAATPVSERTPTSPPRWRWPAPAFDATQVELVADPAAAGNTHEIEAESAAGRFRLEIQGRPSPTNPATSALTGWSLARALLNRSARIVL